MTGAAVTALLPVKRHRPDYLHEAVGSLLAQTSPDWRALVVHARGVRPELPADPRIRLVEERGRKLAGAINTGMREATTDFTALLFADDLWEPEAVEVLTRHIQSRPDIDFFHSARRYIDDDGNSISDAIAPVEVNRKSLMKGVKHLLCWRRELALSIGGLDESLNSVGPDDFDFPWSMADAGARFGSIPDCLYVYRDHRSCYRLTTHLPRRTHMREMRRILRKHGVPPDEIDRQLASARTTFLRQCLYSSRVDAVVKRALGREPAAHWRESYR